VLLPWGDHRLLPSLAGERPDRLHVRPHRDVHILGAGRVVGPAHVLSHQSGLPRHERYGSVTKEGLELTLLAWLNRRPEHADDHVAPF
jgi:hypothetical protein